MYKKKKDNRNKFIIFGIAFGIVILFVGLNMFLPKSIRDVSRDGLSFIESIINKPVLLIKNSRDRKDSIENSSNNQLLLDENNELKSEISTLKEQLKLNTILSDKTIINATVINRNLEYWYESLTLDKGSNDGIEVGMGVLYRGYLVGKVSSSSFTTSTIKLLMNNENNSKTSVKIKVKDKEIYGLLDGYKDGKYIIEGISDMSDIPINSVVSTTGLGEIASGITIGKVSGVSTDNFGLAKIVEVTPSIDMTDIDYVMVVSK